MSKNGSKSLFAGLKITSLATLASRILGLLRDMAIASLLGLGGVMDAFALAFRIPNLFRRLLGEGALAASYLPVLTAKLQQDRKVAWQLASVLLTQLTVLLTLLLLVLEGACWLLAVSAGGDDHLRLLAGLAAVMMPYMVLICLTAQLSATLHALGSFAWPAMSPILLNIALLVGAWWLAPQLATDQAGQAYLLAICVLVAGFVQFASLIPPLRKAGFAFDYNFTAAAESLRQIAWAFVPMLFGLAVTQLNTLADSLIAWILSAPISLDGSIPRVAWLPGEPAYPLSSGAVSAVYYGERMYQFPLGMLGVAVATVIFPRFSRHVARGDHALLASDLVLALRLVALWGLPASVGLVLLADPISTLFFQRGEFTATDAHRTASMIAGYGAGVWAYCALPVLVRAFYALGRPRSPALIGALLCVVNFGANLLLVWPLAEFGLAISTAGTAALQVVWLTWLLAKRCGPWPWRSLAKTVVTALLATGLMSLATLLTLSWLTGSTLPPDSSPETGHSTSRLLILGLPLLSGAAVYLLAIRFAPGGKEHGQLLLGHGPPEETE